MNVTTHAANGTETKKLWKITDALAELPSIAQAKFDESVDISLHLGVDARKTMVRGVCPMPSGTGKQTKVAVFARGEDAKSAEEAGADHVGTEDLVELMQGATWPGFDVVIATPELMGMVGKLARKLGPKGLMPNPKLGTVTKQVGDAVKAAKSGQVKFKIDKASIIHCSIGRVSFKPEDLQANLNELIKVIKKLKPAAAKGQYLKLMYISTTMSKQALKLDLSEFTH